MAFCGKCGTKVEDGVKFCPSCGAEVAPATQQANNATNNQQSNFQDKIQNLNNTTDSTADFDPADIEQNKVMGILAYFSWLVLVPIFAAKDSKFAKFHANQGLALAITEVAWWIVDAILSTILYSISWRLGFISTILGLVNILFLIVAVIGIINAANGKAKELPIIGKFKILK